MSLKSEISKLKTAIAGKINSLKALNETIIGRLSIAENDLASHHTRITIIENTPTSNLVSESYEFIGGSQEFVTASEFYKIDKVLVGNTCLSRSQFTKLSDNSFSIDDPLIATAENPVHISIDYWTSAGMQFEGQALASQLETKADLLVSKNLFDKEDITDNYYMSATGYTTANSDYAYSGYIPVIPGQQYIGNASIRFTCYFDKNLNVVPGGSNSALTSFTVPSDSNIALVVLTVSKPSTFQLEKGSVSTAYESFYRAVKRKQLEYFGNQIFRSNTSIEKLDLRETNWAQLSKNIFDKNTEKIEGADSSKIEVDRIVSNSSGNTFGSAGVSTSPMIRVDPSTQYVVSGTYENKLKSYAFYNESGVYIPGTGAINSILLATTAETQYMRISFANGEEATLQLEKGSTPTGYEPYGFTTKLLRTESESSSGWKDVETNVLGDSLVAQNNWQQNVIISLGLNLLNFGIGGTKISGSSTNSFNSDSRINELSDTAELIMVLGGINDWAQSVSLGDEESIDIETFYGALNVLIEKLVNKYPTQTLLFFTTPYGEMPGRVTDGVWATATTNNAGLTTKDYAQAIRKRCEFYGIPYADLDRNMGVSSLNVDVHMNNDGNHIHPNSTFGGKKLASVVIGKLKTLETI